MPDPFDVFLSHNSQDKPVVEEIGERLKSRGLHVWLDKWELRPGFPWQEGLEEGVQASRAAAVCVGAGGLGAWQEPEMRAFIARSRREQIPVIPVLLPGCPDSPQLTLFLEAFTWVDLRQGLSEDGLARLVWGITGEKPQGMGTGAPRGGHPVGPDKRAGARGTRWRWTAGILLLTGVLALTTWFLARSPAPPPSVKPAIYAVRVQVLDPQGRPVRDTKVSASVANEPRSLPDGGWEIEIPSAKVPLDGRVTLRAEHPEWEGNQVDLRLGKDPNPQFEIRLQKPESWLRGQVVRGGDEHDRGVPDVRVSWLDGTGGAATTDADGRFALKLPVPRETKVRLQAEPPSGPLGDTFCFAGRDSCSIRLEKASTN
jgi:TIR domain